MSTQSYTSQHDITERFPTMYLKPARRYDAEVALVSRVAERNTPWLGIVAYLATMPIAALAAAVSFTVFM